MDDAVVVAVHAGAEEVGVDQARRWRRPPRASPLSWTKPSRVAEVEAVGGVPVVVDRSAARRRPPGTRGPGVDDGRQADDEDRQHEHGNSVPPWKRTFLPLPFWASRAAFLVDDEETTRARAYRRVRPVGPAAGGGIGERVDEVLVGRRHAGRRGRAEHPRAGPASPIAAALAGSATSAATAAAKPVGVVGRHDDAGAGRGEDPRHLGAGVDRGDDGPAGGEDRVRLRRARSPRPGPARSGTTWTSPVASSSTSRSSGT